VRKNARQGAKPQRFFSILSAFKFQSVIRQVYFFASQRLWERRIARQGAKPPRFFSILFTFIISVCHGNFNGYFFASQRLWERRIARQGAKPPRFFLFYSRL
jgi:hypothetical protein